MLSNGCVIIAFRATVLLYGFVIYEGRHGIYDGPSSSVICGLELSREDRIALSAAASPSVKWPPRCHAADHLGAGDCAGESLRADDAGIAARLEETQHQPEINAAAVTRPRSFLSDDGGAPMLGEGPCNLAGVDRGRGRASGSRRGRNPSRRLSVLSKGQLPPSSL